MLEWLLSLFCQPSKPVNTRDEALNVAQTAIYKKWGHYDYSSYEKRISYDSQSDVWHFRYLRRGCSNMFGGMIMFKCAKLPYLFKFFHHVCTSTL